MAKLGIYTGSSANDNTGDSLLTGAIKINKNFDEIYSFLGAGSTDVLSTPLWSKTSVGINTLQNVGIGTTNPTSHLTVEGNASISGILTSNSAQITSLFGTNFVYSGISTVGSLSIGSTQVVSSSRQLQNIVSLDSITISTIENAIQSSPNNFDSLNVSGVSTLGNTIIGSATTELIVNGSVRISGVVTASSFHGNATSATYATTAGVSTYSSSSGIATYATTAGIATYATTAGIATYSSSSGIATYATTAGIATYSITAGIATYSSSSGIATYATTAGISTYSSSSGIASYSDSAGISTVAQGLTGTPDIFVGVATITSSLNVGLAATIFTATPNGLVGINSTAPSRVLDVIGDVKVGIDTSQGIILTSPNGTQYRLIVDDVGVLSTVTV